MKTKFKKWTVRLAATIILIAGLLLIIVLNPILTYANKTKHNNHTVFHHQKLDHAFLTMIDDATELLKSSEFYNPNLHFDICLNDGSAYPDLLGLLRGKAFAWGFYNKVVLQGNANAGANYLELNEYKWNLTQLLAHEMTHCLQFDNLGFWKSNPIGKIPEWKWEGYAEYVSRQNDDQKNLSNNISRLITTDKNNWAVNFSDGTVAPRSYYENWILLQYCIDIKKMTYKQLLADTTSEQTVRKEMMAWFGEVE